MEGGSKPLALPALLAISVFGEPWMGGNMAPVLVYFEEMNFLRPKVRDQAILVSLRLTVESTLCTLRIKQYNPNVPDVCTIL